jgi:HEAT repeat protein
VISRSHLELAILVLALLIAAGLLLILGHGLAVWLERLAYGRRTQEARRALAEAIARGEAGPDTRRALQRLSRRRALAVLEELAPNLTGADAATIAEAARDAGIVAKAEAGCGARSWRRRTHAVRVLTRLGSGEAAVPPLLEDPRLEVRAAAAEWAAGHPEEPLADGLLRLLADPEPLTRVTAMDSLIRMRRGAVPSLARAIEGARAETLPVLLQVAARIADADLAGPAAAHIGDAEPLVRMWVARLLGAIGGEEHTAAVQALLDDPAPEVRAAAAVALGRLGHWPSAPAVAERLRDPVWRVRRDAALALRVLGAPGELLLERALRDRDGFARDMARQTLDLPEVALPA